MDGAICGLNVEKDYIFIAVRHFNPNTLLLRNNISFNESLYLSVVGNKVISISSLDIVQYVWNITEAKT